MKWIWSIVVTYWSLFTRLLFVALLFSLLDCWVPTDKFNCTIISLCSGLEINFAGPIMLRNGVWEILLRVCLRMSLLPSRIFIRLPFCRVKFRINGFLRMFIRNFCLSKDWSPSSSCALWSRNWTNRIFNCMVCVAKLNLQ